MEVSQIERKIQETPVPEVHKVAVAYSGGLDSTLGIALLRRKYKADEIVPITVDVGQGEDEIDMAFRHGDRAHPRRRQGRVRRRMAHHGHKGQLRLRGIPSVHLHDPPAHS